jgi:hypothetical protein
MKSALDDAQESLQKTAWRKDWAVEAFRKKEMKGKALELNEYIGFINHSEGERLYCYCSLFFQSFCAAWFASEFSVEEENKIFRHLYSRREIPTHAQVLSLLNQLREANNRLPITLSRGG